MIIHFLFVPGPLGPGPGIHPLGAAVSRGNGIWEIDVVGIVSIGKSTLGEKDMEPT